jgi:predicted transposase YbfD/YdcC
LGCQFVDQKFNEIMAIPELLKKLELKGAIITMDAMGSQKDIAAQIVDGGGDYVLAIKDNHPTLHRERTATLSN